MLRVSRDARRCLGFPRVKRCSEDADAVGCGALLTCLDTGLLEPDNLGRLNERKGSYALGVPGGGAENLRCPFPRATPGDQ